MNESADLRRAAAVHRGRSRFSRRGGHRCADWSPPPRKWDCPPRDGRRGAALIIAIVCLAVASALLMSVVRMTAARRGASRAEAWQTQAGWLAESGIDRAAARLRADPSYRGETWNVPADALGGAGGIVRIEIQTPTDRPNTREIRATADYPDDPAHRARESRRVVVAVTHPTGDKP